ncbi:phosphate acetyltransferase [Thalassotalea marina]|uniref:Phosphate acetyltransferase n=1 Tax=Thalassotalea marina TaxID=1673741 RepID=A0A919EKX8_9GAMM|nr:phosphate acetyltransferase [Thalassotalea marina]GHF93534.1 phosphate acetyltransferase [Thalassotalea marina]
MSKRLMLVPAGFGVGLTSVTLGLYHACQQLGISVGHFKPISQPSRNYLKNVKQFQHEHTGALTLSLNHVEQQIADGNHEVVLEQIVANFNQYAKEYDLVIIEGLLPTTRQPYAARINRDVARALSADIVLVASPDEDSPEDFEDRLDVTAQTYGGLKAKNLLGCIINKLNSPDKDEVGLLPREHENEQKYALEDWQNLNLFNKNFALLGTVPWSIDLIAPRVIDISNYLQATVINEGDISHRRIRSISFCARSVGNLVSHLQANRLIVTPGDRTDIIIATCLSALNGTKVGALLLTNGYLPEPQVMELCKQALDAGLPILSVPWDTWQTSRYLMNYNPEIPLDDEQRLDRVKQYVTDHLDQEWLAHLMDQAGEHLKYSPPAFRHLLTERAKSADKLIILPEGTDARTIKAAAICVERGIARCQILGEREAIETIAQQQGFELPDTLIITDPSAIREQYVDVLVEHRKHKGMTELMAQQALEDNTLLATLMLAQNEVDGLVSGAVNTTANTIRPALQLIKTSPGNNLVSSVFFMLLPDQVLVYGDCAINPDPNAEQLADIAIQSADSAKRFGIFPKVAMISYSTGKSGRGADVEKVVKATEIVKQLRPDIIIDGPLQYDAAIMENVAKQKAPNSPVAGQATVFVFPDLNTGNTTYKAVQRSADVVSIGPMLQGLNKPVNDLSRGALVDDIVYTIALTAIQAT